MERLAMLTGDPAGTVRPIAVIPVGQEMERQAMALAYILRGDGLTVELAYRGNLGRRMKRANRLNARAAVILGPDEAARGAATLRDFDSGAQEEVPLASLSDRLGPYR
jgi:histidyl-tRNA synthetase